MAKRKIFSAEQILMKLREAEVLLSQGKSTKEACRVLDLDNLPRSKAQDIVRHWSTI